MKKILLSILIILSTTVFSYNESFTELLSNNSISIINYEENITSINDIINNSTTIQQDTRIDEMEFLGAPFFDAKDFWRLVLKTLFNLIVILIIVRGIYYPLTKNKDYLFTYLLISLTVFILCILLDDVKLSFGFALGLFAIFGIIRYRTDVIPIKEMTYLFLVIGISVVNALANKKISYSELIFANFLIVFVTYGMERLWLLKSESKKNIIYEKIELIVPEKKEELLADLKKRTGIDIIRFEITKIDFLRDVANISIFYYMDDEKKA